jgi:Fe-S-cluster containining protein
MSIQYPAIPRGACVFLEERGCIIYPVRPYECGVSVHTDDEEKDFLRHLKIAVRWKNCDLLNDYREKVICYEPSFSALYGMEAKHIENKHVTIIEKIRKQKEKDHLK